jgi:hypothetical protein
LVESKKAGIEITPLMLVGALAAVIGLSVLAWLSFSSPPRKARKPVLTPEAREYLHYLQLSDVQPQTSESYVQGSLFEILGNITNNGPQNVHDVEVTCVFRDYYGKEVKREAVSVVNGRGGVLPPKGTQHFRLAFDDLPDEWNRQMPDLVIAEIGFR